MKQTVALALFSGGLDSILACKVVASQGIKVVALKFVTPFFDYHLLEDPLQYTEEIQVKYGIDVELIDLSQGYLKLLHSPVHGFGKNFNPCIDCKILMMTRARELMARYGASFLFTGEVMGQRPMSQRKDTLRVIEREAGCTDILLRPLSAQLLPPILAEREGLIDRSRLHAFSGRTRKPQMKLAEEFGISDYPSPAGGCILTDENLGKRIQNLYSGYFLPDVRDITVADVNLLLVGRQFMVDGKYWLVVGRNKSENEQLRALQGSDDWLLKVTGRPGPTAILRYGTQLTDNPEQEEVLSTLAGILVHYSKKVDGETPPAEVTVVKKGDTTINIYKAVAGGVLQPWKVE